MLPTPTESRPPPRPPTSKPSTARAGLHPPPGALSLHLSMLASPLGHILLVTDPNGVLRALDFHDYEPRMHRLLRLHYGPVALHPTAAPALIVTALAQYFAGNPVALNAIPTQTAGTPFQRRVWAALRTILPGHTETYAGLAARIGHPAACRAVGGANGANPIAIVVPCHRIIAQNKKLTGFGGGLHRKAWLLAHENPSPCHPS